ncbi:MAG: addiction module protein [Acidobacteria bacterium]|nr:addiction module protein [Acidobacteriota bacterium]
MNTILEQALRLPMPERRKLADDLYDSIVSGSDGFSLSQEQRSEIDRRLADLREHPDKALPWGDVRERLRKVA